MEPYTKKTQAQIENILMYQKQGKCAGTIASLCGLNHETVRRVLRAHGVNFNSKGRLALMDNASRKSFVRHSDMIARALATAGAAIAESMTPERLAQARAEMPETP